MGAIGSTKTKSAAVIHRYPGNGPDTFTYLDDIINGGGLYGTTTNDNAAAGFRGEYVSSTVLVANAVSLTTATAADVTSISLTAGDWDVSGNVVLSFGATTSVTLFEVAINTTSATFPTFPGSGAQQQMRWAAFVPVGSIAMPTGTRRISLSGTTTVYLIGAAVFTVSTAAAYGFIGARRAR